MTTASFVLHLCEGCNARRPSVSHSCYEERVASEVPNRFACQCLVYRCLRHLVYPCQCRLNIFVWHMPCSTAHKRRPSARARKYMKGHVSAPMGRTAVLILLLLSRIGTAAATAPTTYTAVLSGETTARTPHLRCTITTCQGRHTEAKSVHHAGFKAGYEKCGLLCGTAIFLCALTTQTKHVLVMVATQSSDRVSLSAQVCDVYGRREFELHGDRRAEVHRHSQCSRRLSSRPLRLDW